MPHWVTEDCICAPAPSPSSNSRPLVVPMPVEFNAGSWKNTCDHAFTPFSTVVWGTGTLQDTLPRFVLKEAMKSGFAYSVHPGIPIVVKDIGSWKLPQLSSQP